MKPLPESPQPGWPWQPETAPKPKPSSIGTEWPRISIVTPSFNQGKFLEACIRSVLLQGYPNLEYRVMDGGSSDESVSILKRYSPWLTSWVSEPDAGQSAAINRGWRESSGEIIAYINSDDLYLPGAFWQVAQYAQKFSQAGFWIGSTQVCSADLSPLGLLKPRIPSLTCDLTLINRREWAFPQQSCFWRRSALKQAGFLREELHYVMDRELFYRLCRITSGQVIPAALAVSRAQNEAKSIRHMLEMYREDRLALKMQNDNRFWPNLYRRWQARRFLGFGYLRQAKNTLKKHRAQASLYFALAAWYDPQRLLERSFYGELSRLFTSGDSQS